MAYEAFEKMKRAAGTMLSGDTLKAKVFRGGIWLGIGSTVEQVSRFGRNMLLTRLLAPEAFGMMAIVMSATSALGSFLDTGAREALIQNPRGTEETHVRATWWLCLGRALSIYICLFLAAPLLAWFYGNPQLSGLLRVAGSGLLFEGLLSTRYFAASKEMKFRKVAAVNYGGGVAGVLTTIILSFILRNVWALAIGFVAENAARCILSYLVCPFVPRFKWDREAMRELLEFSRGVFGLAVLNLIFMRSDIFVIAKMFPPAVVGVYAVGVYLVQTPMTFIISLISATMMPAFTHVQNDAGRLNRILLQTTAAIFVLGMPALVFLFFCGRSLLTLVYGQRYGAASGPLIVAGCASLVNVANTQITTIFYAKGKPQLHRRCVAIMAVLMLLLTYPFVKWFGLVGGQLAGLISIVVGFLFQVERICKMTGLSSSQYRNGFLGSAAISLSVVGVCLSSSALGAWQQPLPNILIGMGGCLVAYAVAYAFLFGVARDRLGSILGF